MRLPSSSLDTVRIGHVPGFPGFLRNSAFPARFRMVLGFPDVSWPTRPFRKYSPFESGRDIDPALVKTGRGTHLGSLFRGRETSFWAARTTSRLRADLLQRPHQLVQVRNRRIHMRSDAHALD